MLSSLLALILFVTPCSIHGWDAIGMMNGEAVLFTDVEDACEGDIYSVTYDTQAGEWKLQSYQGFIY